MCPCIQSLMLATTTSLLLVERRWLSLSRLRAVKLRGCSELTRIHHQSYRVRTTDLRATEVLENSNAWRRLGYIS